MSKLTDFISMIINERYVHKIGSDLLAIIIVGIPVLTLFLVGEPYQRGFNCDDESIRYPYKDNTITSTFLYFYSTTIPIVTIIIVEFLYFRQNASKFCADESLTGSRPKYTQLLWQIYCRLSPFIFGALISQMTTDIAKYSIGRLRPHFIDVCKPRSNRDGVIFTLENYKDCKAFEYLYITDFECSSDYPDSRKKDSRLSFMSGHSSFAAFCLIYLVIYLQVRVKWSTIGFLRPLYQSLLIYLVLYTGFTRVSDYKHHWSDVFIGLIQGTIVAILAARYISDLFVKDQSPKRNSIGAEPNKNGSTIGINRNPNKSPNYNSCRLEMDESTSY